MIGALRISRCYGRPPGPCKRALGPPRPSTQRMELEDSSALGCLQRMVEIDTVGQANERDAAGDASRDGTENVAEELDSLRGVQLGRRHFFLPAANGDGRAAGGPQVPHPVDLAPRGPHPAPARDVDDRHWPSA